MSHDRYLPDDNLEGLLSLHVCLDEIVDFLAERGRNGDSREGIRSLTQAILLRILDKTFIDGAILLAVAELA